MTATLRQAVQNVSTAVTPAQVQKGIIALLKSRNVPLYKATPYVRGYVEKFTQHNCPHCGRNIAEAMLPTVEAMENVTGYPGSSITYAQTLEEMVLAGIWLACPNCAK